ncbi:MAG: histidine kinase, partial [Oceanicoccus sp.]|uniref:FIST N-terminal domain-containing protein n=1 Tax=Oceanicoccus sp. TaxID=2691044 RepID=UPI00261CAD7E
MAGNVNVKGLLILACDENGFTPQTTDNALKAVPVPLFGGIFPAVIHGQEKLQRGTIVAGLAVKPDVYTVPNLSDIALDYDEVIENLIPETGVAKTMFVFVDGYSQRISSLIESLYTVMGLQCNYIGGGAGSINPSALDMSNTPCLFTNEGLVKDSALLALVDIESGVGVGHGWHKISGSYKVTESNGNAIKSLDWRP